MPSFGDRFKALREKNGWTQEDVAEKLGVSRPSIAGYETKNRTPRKEMLNKIADLFGVSIDYLMGRAEKDEKKEEMSELEIRYIKKLETLTMLEHEAKRLDLALDHPLFKQIVANAFELFELARKKEE